MDFEMNVRTLSAVGLLPYISLGLLALSGCVTGNKFEDPPQQTADVRSRDSGTTAIPVTFTDRRTLQYDTGQTDPEIPQLFKSTSSGLRYRILRKSEGRKPGPTSPVTVHYRGWLDNGKEFDSSYDSAPAKFRLNEVVAGWGEGLQLIGEGGMIELWIPGSLGYGKAGRDKIPPNATLHFVVELISVNE